MVKRTLRLVRVTASAIIMAVVFWLALLQLTWVWLATSPESVLRWVEVISQERMSIGRIELRGDWTHPRLTLHSLTWQTPEVEARFKTISFDLDWFGYIRHPGVWGDQLRVEQFHIRRTTLVDDASELNLNPTALSGALDRSLSTLALPFRHIYLVDGSYMQGRWQIKLPALAILQLDKFRIDGLTNILYDNRLLWGHVIHGALFSDWRGHWQEGRVRIFNYRPARLADLAPILDADWRHGELALNGELGLERGHPKARLDMDLGALTDQQQALSIKKVRSAGMTLEWQERAGANRFAIQRWRLNGKHLPNTYPAYGLFNDNRLQLKVERFSLDAIKPVLRELFPQWPFEQTALDIEGIEVDFRLRPFALMNVAGEVRHLQMPESEFVPGMVMDQVSLGLKGDEIVTAFSKPVILRWAAWQSVEKRVVFSQPLYWRIGDRGIQLEPTEFRLDDRVAGRLAFSLLDGRLQVDTALEPQTVANVKPYLPYGIMSDELAQWLQSALVAGKVEPVTLRIDGPVDAFPFKKGEGLFEAETRISEMTLRFSPEWPDLNGLDASIRFTPWKIVVNGQRGSLAGVQISRAHAEIDALDGKDIALRLSGHARGSAPALQRLLLSSMLARKLGLEAILGQTVTLEKGHVAAELALWVPLYGYDGRDLGVHIDAVLDQIGLRLAKKHYLERLNGKIRINQMTAISGKINGRLDGQPVSLKLSPDVHRNRLNLLVKGKWPIASVLADARGMWRWWGQAAIPLRSGGIVTLSGEFHPEKLAENRLPAPLDQWITKPVKLQGRLRKDDLWLQLSQENRRHVSVRFRPIRNAWTFYSLTAVFDTQQTVRRALLERRNPGIVVHGKLAETLLISKLHDWWSRQSEKLPETGSASLPTVSVTLGVKELRYGLQRFQQVTVTAHNIYQRGVGVKLRSGQAAAQLVYLPEQDQWIVRVDNLHWKTAAAGGKLVCTTQPERPKRLHLVFVGYNIRFGQYPFEIVSFHLHGDSAQLKVENLYVRADHQRLEGTGSLSWSWRENRSRLTFTLNAKPVEAFLKWADFRESGFTGRKGRVEGEIAWSGTFDCFSLMQAEGKLRVRFDDGVIQQAKVGMAKLLSLLSVDSLLRSIDTTVNQLRYEGMAYDLIEADAKLAGGVAQLQRFELEAPLVHASLKGQVDYVRRRYDLHATVSPKIAGTMTTLATIFGVANPLAALTTYLLVKNLPGLEAGLIRYRYSVQGPWTAPKIISLDGNSKPAPSGQEEVLEQ